MGNKMRRGGNQKGCFGAKTKTDDENAASQAQGNTTVTIVKPLAAAQAQGTSTVNVSQPIAAAQAQGMTSATKPVAAVKTTANTTGKPQSVAMTKDSKKPQPVLAPKAPEKYKYHQRAHGIIIGNGKKEVSKAIPAKTAGKPKITPFAAPLPKPVPKIEPKPRWVDASCPPPLFKGFNVKAATEAVEATAPVVATPVVSALPTGLPVEQSKMIIDMTSAAITSMDELLKGLSCPADLVEHWEIFRGGLTNHVQDLKTVEDAKLVPAINQAKPVEKASSTVSGKVSEPVVVDSGSTVSSPKFENKPAAKAASPAAPVKDKDGFVQHWTRNIGRANRDIAQQSGSSFTASQGANKFAHLAGGNGASNRRGSPAR